MIHLFLSFFYLSFRDTSSPSTCLWRAVFHVCLLSQHMSSLRLSSNWFRRWYWIAAVRGLQEQKKKGEPATGRQGTVQASVKEQQQVIYSSIYLLAADVLAVKTKSNLYPLAHCIFSLSYRTLLLSNIFSQSSSLSRFCQLHYSDTHTMFHLRLVGIFPERKVRKKSFRSLRQCIFIPSDFQVYVLTGRCIVTVLCNQRLKTQTKRLRRPVSTWRDNEGVRAMRGFACKSGSVRKRLFQHISKREVSGNIYVSVTSGLAGIRESFVVFMNSRQFKLNSRCQHFKLESWAIEQEDSIQGFGTFEGFWHGSSFQGHVVARVPYAWGHRGALWPGAHV